MKTAMQELIDMTGILPLRTFQVWLGENYSRLLEKEKEQIKKAREDGFDAYAKHKGLLTHEQYYNKTYKQYGLDYETRQIINNL